MKQIGKKHRIKDRWGRCVRLSKALLADQSGGVLIFSALALPVILGAAAMALDVTSWYATQRHLQTVADSSAMAAMHVLSGGGSSAEAETAARSHAQARLGFIDDAKRDIQVAYDDGVVSGTGYEAISVTAVQRRQPLLSALFMAEAVDVRAGATAANQVQGENCVLSLDQTASPAIKITGGASVNVNCGLASNSSAADSISVEGSASLTADQIRTYGEVNGEAQINGGDPSKTQQHFFRQDDPYAGLAVPPFTGCDVNSKTIVNASDDVTLTPKTYCNDISVVGGTLHLDPGVYILYGADFKVTGGTVTGSGVTIILTGGNPNTVGNVALTGGTVTLAAPDKNGQTDPNFFGEYAGVLFFMDPAAAPGGTPTKFTGGINMNLDGAIYMPSRSVDFAGHSSAGPTGCLQIVAQQVNFTGGSGFDNSTAACQDLGVNQIGERRVRLTM